VPRGAGTGSFERVSAAARVLGALLLALVVSACGRARRPNVLVVLIDTLRADRLGVYGNDRGLTPFLDALAPRGTLFEHAYASSCWTVPSVASLFTSRYPSQHHMVTFASRLPESELTLAERLRAAGWITGGFVGNPNLQPVFGYAQGFDEWWAAPPEDPGATDGDRVRAQALGWLDRTWHRGSDRPVFLYVHYMEPHAPYEPREPFRHRFAVDDAGRALDTAAAADAFWRTIAFTPAGPNAPDQTPDFGRALRDRDKRLTCLTPEDDDLARIADQIRDRLVFGSSRLYDAEVAAVDEQIHVLFDELARRGFFERAVTIVTADHGEEFLDHGALGHANALYEESVHVPLIMTGVGVSSRQRIAADVSLVDVAPTLLDLLRLSPEPPFEGRSLVTVGPRDVILEFEPIFADSADLREHTRGLVRGRTKLLVAPDGRAMTYDLARDPHEQHGDPTDASAATAVALAAAEDRLAARAGGSAPTERIDDALAQRLKALGYTH